MHLSGDKTGLDDHSTTIAIHLKMSGQLILKKDTDPRDRFNHVIIQLDRDEQLHFNDLRKFGFIRVIRDKGELDKILSVFGPEPFTKEFTLEVLKKILVLWYQSEHTVSSLEL